METHDYLMSIFAMSLFTPVACIFWTFVFFMKDVSQKAIIMLGFGTATLLTVLCYNIVHS